MIETSIQDLTHALRMSQQNPSFTPAAVAALTLEIGPCED